MRSIIPFLVIVLLLILTSGCSESPPAQPAVSPTGIPVTPSPIITTTLPTPLTTPSRAPSVSDNTVIIEKNTFTPATMTVNVGSTVRWYSKDEYPHNIEFTDKAFSASTYLLVPSQPTFSQRFNQAGTYHYSCTIHPDMQGTIIVEA